MNRSKLLATGTPLETLQWLQRRALFLVSASLTLASRTERKVESGHTAGNI